MHFSAFGGDMKRLLLLPILLASTSVFANLALDHHDDDDHLGSAHHSGTGKVYHDGDFIEFSLSFDAACYSDRSNSWNNVTNNVASFIEWLNSERDQLGEVVSYDVDPINVWRSDNSYAIDGCNGTHYAAQSIKVTLYKAEGNSSLHTDLVQDFYGRLQEAVWPLSYTEEGELPSRVSTTITGIEKGLYEETADALRITAKGIARSKATQDFLSFLGEDYHGTWYLQSVDFREHDFSPVYRSSVEAYPAVPPAPGGFPAPALLKLKPLSLSVTGNFHFVFDVQYGSMSL